MVTAFRGVKVLKISHLNYGATMTIVRLPRQLGNSKFTIDIWKEKDYYMQTSSLVN